MAKSEKKEQTKPQKKRTVPKIIDFPESNLKNVRDPDEEKQEYEKFIRTRHEIQGILYGALSLLLFLSLITYHVNDPTLFSGEGATQNIAGIIGAIIADFFLRFFGYIAYLFPFIAVGVSIDKLKISRQFVNGGSILGTFLTVLCLCASFSLPSLGVGTRFSPGGFLGVALATFLINYFNIFGSLLIILTGLMTACLLFNRYLLHENTLLFQANNEETTPQIIQTKPETLPIQNKPSAKRGIVSKITDRLKKNPISRPLPNRSEKKLFRSQPVITCLRPNC